MKDPKSTAKKTCRYHEKRNVYLTKYIYHNASFILDLLINEAIVRIMIKQNLGKIFEWQQPYIFIHAVKKWLGKLLIRYQILSKKLGIKGT